uniref:Pinin_SDK_memA domain-containing protein n=1 Tax=Heterorhabditis bacteriophora TaxID=37862 RepID=A0A1I7W8M1_HETBA
MRQPTCNIAVDQRVCRGSVFAARRQAALKFLLDRPRAIEKARGQQQNRGTKGHTERDEQGKETEYKVGVLRSQLESSLPQVALPRTRPHRGRGDHRLSYRKVQLPTMAPQSIDKEFRNVKLLPLKTTGNHVETIARAIETLETEKQLESLRREAEETRRVLERERKKQLETEHRVRWTIGEKDRIIAESRQREEDSKTSKALAVQTCREFFIHLIMFIFRLFPNLVMNSELEKDFFPWIFAKAERVFRHKLACVHLENGTLHFVIIMIRILIYFLDFAAIFTEVSLEKKQAREKLQPSFT